MKRRDFIRTSALASRPPSRREAGRRGHRRGRRRGGKSDATLTGDARGQSASPE
jgi:hypothetical protein